MPIVEYRCQSCHNIDVKVLPVSKCGNDHPETERSKCSKCRKRSDRIYDYNGHVQGIGFTDKSQSAIVVHLNTKTGEYSIPGHRDDELPGKNYKRVPITSIKQYEKLCKSVDATELEKAQFNQAIEREYFDSTLKANRESTRNKMEEAIRKGGHYVQEMDDKGVIRTRWAPITPRARQLFDLACKRADAHRTTLRQGRESGRPNFHSRILEHRTSEQSIVSGTAKRADVPTLKELAQRLERLQGKR